MLDKTYDSQILCDPELRKAAGIWKGKLPKVNSRLLFGKHLKLRNDAFFVSKIKEEYF